MALDDFLLWKAELSGIPTQILDIGELAVGMKPNNVAIINRGDGLLLTEMGGVEQFVCGKDSNAITFSKFSKKDTEGKNHYDLMRRNVNTGEEGRVGKLRLKGKLGALVDGTRKGHVLYALSHSENGTTISQYIQRSSVIQHSWSRYIRESDMPCSISVASGTGDIYVGTYEESKEGPRVLYRFRRSDGNPVAKYFVTGGIVNSVDDTGEGYIAVGLSLAGFSRHGILVFKNERLSWYSKLNPCKNVAIVGNKLLAGVKDALHCFYLKSGKHKWELPMPHSENICAMSIKDDTLYLGTGIYVDKNLASSGSLYALDIRKLLNARDSS